MSEWYGNLPNGWETKKINSLFIERRNKVSDKDYMPLSVSKGGIVLQIAMVAKSNDGDNRKQVCVGDFVINSRSDRRGSSGISNYNGSVSLINIVLEPRHQENGRYWHYLLKSHYFIEEYYCNGRGIVADLWITRYSEMKNIYLPVPPLPEQDQIVRYLDWKVSQINKLINAKKKQIEFLKEQKQALINQAVTKGGEGWKCIPLKRLVRDINEKGNPRNTFYVGMENIKSWTAEYIETNSLIEGDCKRFQKGDILFGKLRPYLAKVCMPDSDGTCSGEFLVLRDYKGFLPFLKYSLLSYDFIMLVNASTYGAKKPRANWSFIGNCIVSYPPIEEQQKIVEFLNKLSEIIDTVINNETCQIELLQEYRTRLISDVVTGKKDVQDIVVPEYEPIEETVFNENENENEEIT